MCAIGGCSVCTAAGILSSNIRNEQKRKREGRLCPLGPPGFTRDGFLHQEKETSCAEDHMITPNLF